MGSHGLVGDSLSLSAKNELQSGWGYQEESHLEGYYVIDQVLLDKGYCIWDGKKWLCAVYFLKERLKGSGENGM